MPREFTYAETGVDREMKAKSKEVLPLLKQNHRLSIYGKVVELPYARAARAPTTNHPYVPSLKKRLGKKSRVPEGIKYIPEIVINGKSIAAVKEAMKVGIRSTCEVNGVARISAGNYEGKLGSYRIRLRESFL